MFYSCCGDVTIFSGRPNHSQSLDQSRMRKSHREAEGSIVAAMRQSECEEHAENKYPI